MLSGWHNFSVPKRLTAGGGATGKPAQQEGNSTTTFPPELATHERYSRDWYKRPFDLTILVVVHVLLLPLWLFLWIVIPLAIRLADRGPVFYTQRRLGKNGKPFNVIKFRTMIKNAEASTGPVWASDNDSRITGVGRALRRFRLDEIPQVINIWKGEMSLVGPRPERPELAEEFSGQLPRFTMRLRVRPGIAGLAQVRGRYSTKPGDKLRYDNIYIDNMSPLLDLKLLILSVFVAIRSSFGLNKPR